MINLEQKYTPRVNPGDADYPFGSIKGDSSPGAGDGTPLSSSWGNDIEGFRQAVMTEAGIAPSGQPDNAHTSQLWSAMKDVLRQEVPNMGWTPIEGSFELGGTITARNQIMWLEAAKAWYSWQGVIPVDGYVVPPRSTPATAGGVSPTAWVDRTDGALRSELLRTPLSFGAVGDGITNDSSALIAYDAYCSDVGVPFDGLGLKFAITATTLQNGTFKNASFVPHQSHVGDGPTFTVNSVNGVCYHENIKVSWFTNNGAKVVIGGYSGTPTFASVNSDYSNNGSLLRTTTASEVDMSSLFVIPVDSTSGFPTDTYVWIGDGKYKVESSTASTLTLINNGAQATLYSGARNKFKAGQFVTKDANGKNGITIGDGGQGWNLDIDKLKANSCGWFGVFHWANSKAGTQNIHGATASGCGYIGLGLGHTNKGRIESCITEYNGNNGIDTLSSTSAVSICGGVSRYNGVDGVYIGGSGDGEIGKLFDYDARNNRRLGFLLNSSNVAASYWVSNVDCRYNDYRSLTLTGCGIGSLLGVRFGGALYGNSTFFEGKAGCAGLQRHTLDGCHVTANAGGFTDIGGNVTDYTNLSFGAVNIVDTYMIDGAQLTSDVYGVNPAKSKCRPASYVSMEVSADTVAVNGIIAVTLTFKLPFATASIDLSTTMAKFSTYTSSAMTAQNGFTAVTRTAGVEITPGLTHWICSGNFGSLTYNVSLSSAGSRFLVVDVDGHKIGKTLTWA